MPATAVSAALSFAINTWLVAAMTLAIFLGLYMFELDHRLIVLNQAKAAIDCRSFKPGFYDDAVNEAMVSAISDTARTADQKFDCRALHRADVRLGIADCLKHAKRKDLVVISSWCPKPDELAYLKEFGAVIGCKRLLILAEYNSGPISVQYDSAYKSQNEKPSDK
jgi:hypothetical protein